MKSKKLLHRLIMAPGAALMAFGLVACDQHPSAVYLNGYRQGQWSQQVRNQYYGYSDYGTYPNVVHQANAAAACAHRVAVTRSWVNGGPGGGPMRWVWTRSGRVLAPCGMPPVVCLPEDRCEPRRVVVQGCR